VTGSRVENKDAHTSCEFYNVELDVWFDQPKLNHGRYYHSSCVFNKKWVYVFAGIDTTTKRYFKSIERFDSTSTSENQKQWELIETKNPEFTPRQG